MMWNGFGMGGAWGSWLFGLLLLVGIGLLGVVAVRALGGGVRRGPGADVPPPGRSGARAILDERYARGELSAAEYHERRQTLDEGG